MPDEYYHKERGAEIRSGFQPLSYSLCAESPIFRPFAHRKFFGTDHVIHRSGVYSPKFSHSMLPKTWRENFFVLVREVKNLRATAKKISRHFFRKYEPQPGDFRFVFHLSRSHPFPFLKPLLSGDQAREAATPTPCMRTHLFHRIDPIKSEMGGLSTGYITFVWRGVHPRIGPIVAESLTDGKEEDEALSCGYII